MARVAEQAPGGSHVVQFYGHDDEFLEGVGQYLTDGLLAGATVIVVATAEHRVALEAHLEAGRVDTADVKARETFVSLDAAETIARFAVDDEIDAGAFNDVIGGLIRGALNAGRPVYVFGEMVAVLWDAGYVTAAIELEGLWNDLRAHLPFGLYCAYPQDSVGGDGLVDALHSVCRLHSSVVGGSVGALPDGVEIARSFARDIKAPGQARHFVTRTLETAGHRARIADAALVVTELATNAVLHADSEFTVRICSGDDTIRLTVEDARPVRPMPRDAAVDALSGRGVAIVAALSKRWGVERHASGKAVWAELAW